MHGIESEKARIQFLFRKYLHGICSDEEAREIITILEDSENDFILIEEALALWETLKDNHNIDLNPAENLLLPDQILDRLHRRVRLDKEEIPIKNYSNRSVFAIFSKIAAILILPLLAYSIYHGSRTKESGSSDVKVVVWQTVKTPVGIQADFLLPDSSHVWLNSGSVFKYPVSFAKDKRQVELTGEAFFDVAKDELHPFLVKAGKMNVEVKGTRFNVINYPDESLTELILESGSVRLFSGNYEDNKTITNIKPGELAIYDTVKNKLSVSKVDVRKYTAWKEGMLIFRDDHMEEVVRKLNRWFNVEIILQSPELKEYVYTATYRDETLPQILELLKISAPLKYSITERERLNDNSYSKRKIVINKRK